MADVIVVGSFVQDFAFRTSDFPAPGESRIGRFATGPGGKGFNQAVACSRQGASTLFVGACGADMFGQQAKAFADDNALQCAFEDIDDQPSGAASIVIDDSAQNQIVVALGANDALSIAHIDAQTESIAAARIVLSQLESHLPATQRAFELARAAGVATVLNPAPINPQVSAELLSLVDILTPNETEFAFLCKHLLGVTLPDRYWTSEAAALHEHCRSLGVPAVIVTLGGDGCFVSLDDSAADRAGTPAYFSAGPADVNPVDTTGAGDAFNGGLVSALSRTGPSGLEAALTEANQVAGLSIEKPGTAPAMPTRAEREQRFGALPAV